MSSSEGEKPLPGRAVLKDAVSCKSGEARALAPRGEYDIERCAAGIGLCSCATQNRFTLSFDAFLQHLHEGRIQVPAATCQVSAE